MSIRVRTRTSRLSLTIIGLLCLAWGCDAAGTDVMGHSEPIIGGEPVGRERFPSAGALLFDGEFFCNGTLIAPRVVLTAAHCVEPRLLGGVVPDFTFTADANEVIGTDILAGVEAHAHPDFDLSTEEGANHDIGIVILATAVVGVEETPIPRAEEVVDVGPGTEIHLVGYGTTEPNGEEGGIKHHATAEITDVSEHRYAVGVPGESQNCRGDSGGPGFLETESGTFRTISVVSGGPEPCTQGGFHIRVDSHLPFILPFLGDEGCEGPLVECSGACVDLNTNESHCGECDRPCRSDEGCLGGRCEVGVSPDASTSPRRDASTADGGAGEEPPSDCGCRVRPDPPARPLAWLLALTIGSLLLRKRRRRTRGFASHDGGESVAT